MRRLYRLHAGAGQVRLEHCVKRESEALGPKGKNEPAVGFLSATGEGGQSKAVEVSASNKSQGGIPSPRRIYSRKARTAAWASHVAEMEEAVYRGQEEGKRRSPYNHRALQRPGGPPAGLCGDTGCESSPYSPFRFLSRLTCVS